jgi:F-type H+-transporting ATPase subunit a
MSIHASLRAEEILFLGPVPITNSMVMTWLAMIILVAFAYFAGRRPQLVPRGAQNAFEYILEGLLSIVENTAGHYARRVFPLVATLFIFILTANYMGMLPGVGTINVGNPKLHQESGPAGHAFVGVVSVAEASPLPADPPPGSSQGATSAAGADEHHEPEHVPLLRAANADVNMTLGMALIAFLFIHASGMYVHGVVGYIRDDLAKPLMMTPIKLVIELFVPVSLSMRLFGNIFGGEMLLTVMAFPLVALPFMVLELLFGFIQALIFTMLTLIFTSLATHLSPDHAGHEAHGGQAHPGAAGRRPAEGAPVAVQAHA